MRRADEDQATPPLIVTGCVRSGTTILQRVLHRHPDIDLTNELQSFLGLGQRTGLTYFRRILLRGARRRNSREVFYPEGRTASHLGNVLRTVRFAGRIALGWRHPLTAGRVANAYRAVYPDARIVGDKSPSYVARLDELLDHGLSCIVIYRDCRDVVTSTREALRTIWKGMPHVQYLDTTEKIAQRWVQAIEIMERHRDQVCILRYEDLVEQPEQELNTVAQWLGVDPSGLPADLLHGSSVGRHRTDLPQSELATVLEVAGPTLARLGYGDRT